jgi:hypothetical protein
MSGRVWKILGVSFTADECGIERMSPQMESKLYLLKEH